MFIGAVMLVIINGVAADQGGGNWGYQKDMNFSGPDQWKDLPGMSCGGKRQSPINIETRHVPYWSGLRPVMVSRLSEGDSNVSLHTTATSIYLSFSDAWTVSFGGEGCFRPMTIHWHWGHNNSQGSEHTIDGIRYAMEGHIVTYNCKLYRNSSEALHSANGLYVFSILYKIGEENTAIAKLQSSIGDSTKSAVHEIPLTDFIPRDRASYYRYEGSLTTPPCTENVVWTVFRDIQTLSTEQIRKFRSLRHGYPAMGATGDHFRPVMPLDSSFRLVRPLVFVSFNTGTTSGHNTFLMILLMLSLAASRIL